MPRFCEYILAGRSLRLYVGVTGNLIRRVHIHRMKCQRGFTSRYDITRLVYFECTENVRAAIVREKEIKGWRREKKLALIRDRNPAFSDLAEGWMLVSRDPSSPSRCEGSSG